MNKICKLKTLWFQRKCLLCTCKSSKMTGKVMNRYIISTSLFINQYRMHFVCTGIWRVISTNKVSEQIPERNTVKTKRKIKIKKKWRYSEFRMKGGGYAVMVTNPCPLHPAHSRGSPCFWGCQAAAPTSWLQAAPPRCPEPPHCCASSRSAQWVSPHAPHTRTGLSLDLNTTGVHQL